MSGAVSGMDWDPFGRCVPDTPESVPPGAPNAPTRRYIGRVAMIMALIGLVALAVSALVWPPMILPSGVWTASAFGIVIWLDHRTMTQSRSRFQILARHMGFRHELLDMHRVRRTEKSGNLAWESFDPRLEQVFQAIPQLLLPRPGQLIPMELQAQFWGRCKSGVPVWLLMGEMDSAAIAGDAGREGTLITMLAGYRLDRDTGMRAHILAKAPLGAGRRGVQTESIQFNRTFTISTASTDAPDQDLKVRQALTPATQVAFLDLWAQYKSQFIIDGRLCFVRGDVLIPSRDDHDIATELTKAVDAFLAAATRFKRYVE